MFLIFAGLAPGLRAAPVLDSLLNQGNYYFDYERYSEAIAVYEQAVTAGGRQEQLWYRLAYLYEQTEQPAQAIYFLRKIQYTYGGERLDAKIEQLMGQANPARFSSGERWTDTRQWLHRYQVWLLILGLFLAIAAAGVLWLGPSRKRKRLIALSLAATAIVLVSIQAPYVWLQPQPQGVVVAPTSLYEAPSYAAANRQFPIGLGATVQIIATEDIWIYVQMEQFRAWIPAQALRAV